jgi:hypothetical protein
MTVAVRPATPPSARISPPHSWAARFGDLAFAVDFPSDFGAVRRPWRGAGPAPVSLRYAVEAAETPLTSATTAFSRLDADGFVFTAASCHGDGSWATGTGALVLHDAAQSQSVRVQMLQEALFAACFAHLLHNGGLLLHAATLWIDGRAFVVAGPSTAGKSTLAGRFAPDWWSDEHAFLVREGGAWHVLRHVEFRGNEGDFPWRAPLAGLLWLGPQRDQSRTEALTPAAAVQRILPQALVAGAPTAPFVLDAVARLCQEMPVLELSHSLATPLADLAQVIAGGQHAPDA